MRDKFPKTPEEIVMIPDHIINQVYVDCQYIGATSPREVINKGVLQAALGYFSGSKVIAMLYRLELTRKDHSLTSKGKKYAQKMFRSHGLMEVCVKTLEKQEK